MSIRSFFTKPDENGETLAGAAICILLLVSLALIGGQDAEEQERAHSEYCAMVEQKKWPDFKGIYDEHCNRLQVSGNH